MTVTMHEGLPVVDARVRRIDPDNPRRALAATVPCPFCGHRHHFVVQANVEVGALTHRTAHCPAEHRVTRAPVVRPERGYFTRIIENRFRTR